MSATTTAMLSTKPMVCAALAPVLGATDAVRSLLRSCASLRALMTLGCALPEGVGVVAGVGAGVGEGVGVGVGVGVEEGAGVGVGAGSAIADRRASKSHPASLPSVATPL